MGSGVGGFTLWDAGVTLAATPTVTTHRIVHMIRPPNSSGSTGFWAKQLDLVANWADLRAERCNEILSQLSPPLVFWASVLGLDPQRHKWTLEVVAAALRLANHAEMRFKHALACRRPVEMSPQLQPMIQTPGHGSLPSGHATEAHIVAFVLWKLLRAADAAKPLDFFEQLMRQAARVAINRTIAGVHFPVDSAAGQVLGLALGEYFVHRATGPAQAYTSWQFTGTAYTATLDFDWREQWQPNGDARRDAPAGFSKSISGSETSAKADFLGQLWTDAVKEWK
jgi:membrane-associated phospholipid phosphatase